MVFRCSGERLLYLCGDVTGGQLCQCIDAQWCSHAVGRDCCTCVVTLQVASCVSVLMHSDVQMQWGETVVPV